MTDEGLYQLLLKGYIPGDAESESAFLKRTASQQLLSSYALFSMNIDWVPVEVGADVRFFEGAYTEIGDQKAKITLPKKLSPLVSMNELISHELVHAVRCGFNDSPYEEFLAYALSKRGYRRWMGPFFSPLWVGVFFILVALLVPLFSWFLLLLLLLPAFFMSRYYFVFYRVKARIASLFVEDPREILLLLSGSDFLKFSRMCTKRIKQALLSKKCLRFRQICASFTFRPDLK